MAIDWSGFLFGKKTRAAREKEERAEDRKIRKAREVCRYVVYTRARGCCEHCGRALVLLPKNANHEFQIANIHEEPPRSKGTDPTDPDSCVCLCTFCHDDVTHNRLDIAWSVPRPGLRRVPIFSRTIPKGDSCRA